VAPDPIECGEGSDEPETRAQAAGTPETGRGGAKPRSNRRHRVAVASAQGTKATRAKARGVTNPTVVCVPTEGESYGGNGEGDARMQSRQAWKPPWLTSISRKFRRVTARRETGRSCPPRTQMGSRAEVEAPEIVRAEGTVPVPLPIPVRDEFEDG
jgi:hypothetical protein